MIKHFCDHCGAELESGWKANIPIVGPYMNSLHLRVEAWHSHSTVTKADKPADICLTCAVTGVLTLAYRMDKRAVQDAVMGMNDAIFPVVRRID